ncbi:MAG: hypothetical protein Fur005_36670 [Roseiflexaceae bacterium]
MRGWPSRFRITLHHRNGRCPWVERPIAEPNGRKIGAWLPSDSIKAPTEIQVPMGDCHRIHSSNHAICLVANTEIWPNDCLGGEVRLSKPNTCHPTNIGEPATNIERIANDLQGINNIIRPKPPHNRSTRCGADCREIMLGKTIDR